MASVLDKLEKKETITSYLTSNEVNTLMLKTLQDKHAVSRLVSALISAINTNPALKSCDPKAILYAAFKGESLGLLPLPQLGHYYIIPYGRDIQFQMGYKGYIHLAIKSGQFKFINATPIKEGELVSWNKVTEEIQLSLQSDPGANLTKPTIGYYGSFELLNGFKKAVYWTVDMIKEHANKFSKNTSGTFWGKNFDAMGRKTVLKTMLSTYGTLAPAISTAVEYDMQTITPEDIDEGQGNNNTNKV